MKTDNNFVRSGYDRIVDDNYQTIDGRCMQALVEIFPERFGQHWVTDVCADKGSGIVDWLLEHEYFAEGISDAFTEDTLHINRSIISNPPYARNIVDKIIYRQIDRIRAEETEWVAMLLRTGFDHAKTRQQMFRHNLLYAGQLKMLFRPKWVENTETTPIHNYVWHIWSATPPEHPQVWYW